MYCEKIYLENKLEPDISEFPSVIQCYAIGKSMSLKDLYYHLDLDL